MTAPLPPPDTSAMADWERRLWRRHDGAWVSRYTVLDENLNVVDRYVARNDMVSDFERGRYFQRNLYRRGDQVEARRFPARFDGRSLLFEGGRLLEGHAQAVQPDVVLLRFRYLDRPVEVLETITLGTDDDRARTMQQFENGVLRRVTVVFGERRITDRPGVDVDGNDLEPVEEEFWRAHFPGVV
jgi:hypothetical protein